MYTLYGSPGSGSAMVEMALNAAGLDARQVRASTWEPGPTLDELQRVNPLGQIPTLVLPDGQVLTESAAILIHLGLLAPPGCLLPADPAARARVLRGLVYIAANCYPAVGISDYPERWTTARTAPGQERVRQAARAQLRRHWEIFADTFEAQPWRSSARGVYGGPGALDFTAVVVSRWSGARQHLQRARPEFHALLKRLERHERIEPVWRAHFS